MAIKIRVPRTWKRRLSEPSCVELIRAFLEDRLFTPMLRPHRPSRHSTGSCRVGSRLKKRGGFAVLDAGKLPGPPHQDPS